METKIKEVFDTKIKSFIIEVINFMSNKQELGKKEEKKIRKKLEKLWEDVKIGNKKYIKSKTVKTNIDDSIEVIRNKKDLLSPFLLNTENTFIYTYKKNDYEVKSLANLIGFLRCKSKKQSTNVLTKSPKTITSTLNKLDIKDTLSTKDLEIIKNHLSIIVNKNKKLKKLLQSTGQKEIVFRPSVSKQYDISCQLGQFIDKQKNTTGENLYGKFLMEIRNSEDEEDDNGNNSNGNEDDNDSENEGEDNDSEDDNDNDSEDDNDNDSEDDNDNDSEDYNGNNSEDEENDKLPMFKQIKKLKNGVTTVHISEKGIKNLPIDLRYKKDIKLTNKYAFFKITQTNKHVIFKTKNIEAQISLKKGTEWLDKFNKINYESDHESDNGTNEIN